MFSEENGKLAPLKKKWKAANYWILIHLVTSRWYLEGRMRKNEFPSWPIQCEGMGTCTEADTQDGGRWVQDIPRSNKASSTLQRIELSSLIQGEMVELWQSIIYPKYCSSGYGDLNVARTIKRIGNNNIGTIIRYPNGQIVFFGREHCNLSRTFERWQDDIILNPSKQKWCLT